MYRFKETLFALVVSLLGVLSLHAQQNLEFIENKGQWNKNISFKGEMTTGAFALKPDGGYRMLLYNSDDLNKLQNLMHPHESATNSLIKHKIEEQSSTNQITNISNDIDATIHGHVYEIKFINGNPSPIAIPDKPVDSYNNYLIGKDSTKWAGNCKIFNAVTYKDIYPNIDVRYYTDKGSLKYDFIINPGGNPNNIALYVDGANNIITKKGELVIKTSVGDINEQIPSCYLFNPSTGKTTANCNFKVNGNIIRFIVPENIDKSNTIIIDPQFIFSTFTGSRSSNWGYTATYDALGNFYAGGIVFGGGFPVTNGAFQTSFHGGNDNTGEGDGGFDIGIMKFSPLGNRRIYATYLGGRGNDYPHSLVVDDNYNLIVAGKSTSPDYPIYPLSLGHYGQGNAGDNNFDIILTKLNASGAALVGSRVIGGTGNDGVNIANKYPTINPGNVSLRRNYGDDSRSEVIIDSTGNVFIASCTQSKDFPTTPSAFQTLPGSTSATSNRYQDGVVMKFSPDLSTVLFSSFMGGNDDDAAFVLAIDPVTGQLAVAGGTASTDFPGNKLNTISPTFNGGVCDGFVSLIANDGSKILHTSYIGTSGAEEIYGIQFDNYGYPYIMGTTTGKFPVFNANFVQAGSKQFIAKLNKDLSGYVYSTTFGSINASNPNISPTAFLVDRCQNVYVSGWGGLGNTYPHYPSAGTAGLSITNNAIKKVTDGSDFYFFVLSRDANSQLYGSYFGQDFGNYPDHVDGGTSRFDRNGVIYQSLCANCGGGTLFPTTAGAAYPNNGSSGCNLAAIKIAFNLAGVGAAIRSSVKGITGKKTGCVPLSVDFIDTLAEGQKYIWDFGDNSPKQTTTIALISHIYNNVGNYLASVESIDSTSCNVSDVSYVRIRVGNDEAKLKMNTKKLGDCKSVTYQFDNLTTAIKPFSNQSFLLNFGDGHSQYLGSQTITHTFPSNGTYNVVLSLVDTNYCNYPDSLPVILRIADTLKAIIETNPIGCVPYDATLTNASQAGQQFLWDFGDGTTYNGNDISIIHHYADVNTYTIKLTAFDTTTCNREDSTKFVISTKAKPIAGYSYSPQPTKTNFPITFTNLSTGANSYKWNFDDGDSSLLTNPPPHTFNNSRTYRVLLVAYNENGCSDTTEQDIKNIIVPDVEVANAIAPYGVNRTVQVRGFGIDKMDWKIYNRWGQVIFETTRLSDAWDGKYQGKIQAPDVYSYTLVVTLSDGKQYTKKGDITLIR